MINESKFKRLEEITRAHSFRDVQNFFQFWTDAETQHISRADLEEFISIVRNSALSSDVKMIPPDLGKNWPRCSRHHDNPLLLYQIPNCKNRNGWRSRWICNHNWHLEDPAEWCGLEILDRRTERQILLEYERIGRVHLPEEAP